LGHNIEKSDFGKILELYSEHGGKNSIPVKVLRKEDNINPWHYHPKYKKIRRGIASTQRQLTPLTKLASAYNNRISRKLLKQTPQRALLYLEVRDFDPETGTFSPTEYKINTLPSRATYELSGEDLILVPNARNSLESGRRIVMVGEESRGLILTNRFLPLRPKVNPEYLVMMLNTDFVRNQFILACRGAGSPDFRENKLDDIMIPIPDSDDLSSIDAFMESISDKVALKKRLEADVLKTGQEIDKLIKNVIPNAAS
jgi:hypothetical protein